MSQPNNNPNKPAGAAASGQPGAPQGGLRPGQRQGNRPGGPAGRLMPGEKAKDFKGTLLRLGSYLRPYALGLLVVFFFTMLSALLEVVGPKILGEVTTLVFQGVQRMLAGTGGIDFPSIQKTLLFLLALYLIAAVFRFIQNWLMAHVSASVTYRMRKEIDEKLAKLPLSYFDRTPTGEIMSRMTNDVDTVTSSLSEILTDIIRSGITLIGTTVMMVLISPLLAGAVFVTLPLSFFIVRFVIKRSQGYFKDQSRYLGMLNSHVEEMYGGHLVVSAYNGEKRSLADFDGLNQNLYTAARKSQTISGIMMPLMRFVGNLGYVVVSVLGSAMAVSGSVSIGDIQAMLQYVNRFNMPVTELANIFNVLQQTAAAAERVFAFMSEAEEAPDAEGAIAPQTVEGDVNFDHLRFGYTPEKVVIEDLTAKAKAGQKVAIVGETGAGKTTIVKLLMRFYEPTGGAIYIDGIDTQQYTRAGVRNLFGMVLQDTWLYHDTIANNIRYGKEGATDEEVRAAAKAAQADHFIETLPGGYDMVINEDADNLSQGQKQLLTIARVILANPEMLILDEATSSVDTRTEIQIQRAMDALMKGRTSFVIAHRLSTIQNADTIYVMHQGKLVEQGTHGGLLEKGGVYADIYNSQFAPLEEAGAT